MGTGQKGLSAIASFFCLSLAAMVSSPCHGERSLIDALSAGTLDLFLRYRFCALDYAHVWNVNTIFGEDNPLPDRSDFPMDSHLLRVEYTGLALRKLEAYAYLLDFDGRVSERFHSCLRPALARR